MASGVSIEGKSLVFLVLNRQWIGAINQISQMGAMASIHCSVVCNQALNGLKAQAKAA